MLYSCQSTLYGIQFSPCPELVGWFTCRKTKAETLSGQPKFSRLLVTKLGLSLCPVYLSSYHTSSLQTSPFPLWVGFHSEPCFSFTAKNDALVSAVAPQTLSNCVAKSLKDLVSLSYSDLLCCCFPYRVLIKDLGHLKAAPWTLKGVTSSSIWGLVRNSND